MRVPPRAQNLPANEATGHPPTIECNAGINFVQNHHPGTRLEGGKTLPPGQSLCTETLPSRQNREPKAPPLGHKVRKFHKCIHKP